MGVCESGCKSGWRLYYLYTPGLQDKEGRSESPPFCSPSIAPIRSSVALISLPPPPRAGRCGGGSRLRGSSVAKVRLLTSEPLLLSMNSSRRLGTALATRLQTSSPPVGRGEGGACPSISVVGLKENSLSSSSRGEWLFRAHAAPQLRPHVKCTRAHGLDTRPRTHTHACAHTCTLVHTHYF